MIASSARQAAAAFSFPGQIVDVQPFGRGLINDTFLVTTDAPQQPRAVLQRINRRAFPRPELVMENLRALLDHAARRTPASDALRLPDIVCTREGRDYHLDAEGGFWRMLTYIEHTRALTALTGPAQAAEVGGVLGRFHFLTHDLDPARFRTTRAGFHQTPQYHARFREAAAGWRGETDAALDECLEFAEARRATVSVLEDARASGLLPVRIVHGDPKLDNVLFAEGADKAISLIDLDTVQPGLLHYDLGDCLRSCCNPAGESPTDPSEARFDLALCEALLARYFSATRALLTPEELRLVPEAIRLIPFELGLRFLTDHLQGDPYFKIAWPGHNLHRARTQFALVASIEQQEDALRARVAELARA